MGHISHTKSENLGVSMLFDLDLRGPTIAAGLLWFSAQIGSGWYLWIVDVADRVGLKGISTTLMVATRVAVTIAFVTISVTVNKSSPISTTLTSLVLITATTILFSLAAAYYPTVWAFGGSYLLYGFAFGVAWPLVYVVTPRFFPTCVRSSAIAVASSCGKVGSIVQPQLAGHLLDYSIMLTGLVFSPGWGASVVCVTILRKYRLHMEDTHENIVSPTHDAISLDDTKLLDKTTPKGHDVA